MTNKTRLLKEFRADHGQLASEINALIFNWQASSGYDSSPNQVDDSLVDGLRVAIPYWINLILSEAQGFRNKNTNRAFHLLLKDVILDKGTMDYFGILCPSYKKGDSAMGFAETPGNTTYRAFDNLVRIAKNTAKLGLKCQTKMFFADIAIENYNKLSDQDWKDLERILEQDRALAKSYGLELQLLTEFEPRLKEKVGLEGKSEIVPVNAESLERAMWRDRQFYSAMFGWSIEEAEKRTLVHAHSYYWQGVYLGEKLRHPVMVQSSNGYEKAALYNGPDGLSKPCVVYPLKDPANPPTATIPEWPIIRK